MAATFGAYDYFVNKRNRKVVHAAAKFNSIVASLFPENVRERLFADAEEKMRKNEKVKSVQNIDDFMIADDDEDDGMKKNGRPVSWLHLNLPENCLPSCALQIWPPQIADLFPETSILFADIAGFTAWSSTREPTQVFELLESIYSNFDALAEKQSIYKVETIGDCYVAVVGLPKPRKDHGTFIYK
jgi:hypothetical protein